MRRGLRAAGDSTRIGLVCVAAAVAVCCGSARAQVVAAPSPEALYAQRFAAHCAACHGAQGRSELPLVPSLAGQPSFYAITQLFLYRAGRRDDAAMSAAARELSDDDLRGFADLIGRLPPPPAPLQRGDAARLQRGSALALQHRCTACHGSDLAGGQQVARVAHQREDYLVKVLREFRTGKRLGYTSAMAEVLAGLTVTEVDDIAHYVAHLPP